MRSFAQMAFKDELNGGHYQDDAGELLDTISDAIGAARKSEGKIR